MKCLIVKKKCLIAKKKCLKVRKKYLIVKEKCFNIKEEVKNVFEEFIVNRTPIISIQNTESTIYESTKKKVEGKEEWIATSNQTLSWGS